MAHTGGSNFFFVPCLCQTKYINIFLIYSLSLTFIITQEGCDIADHGSMHVIMNQVNMTYAHHKSPSSSVLRASDLHTEGYGFNSCWGLRFLFAHDKKYIIFYYLDESVLVENRPLVNFIRNFIQDSSGVFSISSLVRISMTSIPALTLLLVQKCSCLYNKKKITQWLEDINFIFS